jgi:hypothetical protein
MPRRKGDYCFAGRPEKGPRNGEAARPESVPLDAVAVSLPPHAAALISRVGEAVRGTLISARALGFARNQHGGSRGQRIVAVSDPEHFLLHFGVIEAASDGAGLRRHL